MPFNFGIKDVIDIVLVALLLYYIYRLSSCLFWCGFSSVKCSKCGF